MPERDGQTYTYGRTDRIARSYINIARQLALAKRWETATPSVLGPGNPILWKVVGRSVWIHFLVMIVDPNPI